MGCSSRHLQLTIPFTMQDAKARKRKVNLSLKVSEVSSGIDKNSLHIGAVFPGVVRTVEEHGSVLSLGVAGVSAFLPQAAFTAAFAGSGTPLPGQVLQVVIKQSLRDGRSLIVGCEPAEIAQAALGADHAITMNELLPGQLVTVCPQILTVFQASMARCLLTTPRPVCVSLTKHISPRTCSYPGYSENVGSSHHLIDYGGTDLPHTCRSQYAMCLPMVLLCHSSNISTDA